MNDWGTLAKAAGYVTNPVLSLAKYGNQMLAPAYGMVDDKLQENIPTYKNIRNLPEEIGDRQVANFPSGADWKQANAFRHSYGTGRLAQELGGGMGAQLVAKLAGYGVEGLTSPANAVYKGIKNNDMNYTVEELRDSLSDINNNAYGATQAGYLKTAKELEDRILKDIPKAVQKAPNLFEQGNGVLATPVPRTKRIEELVAKR